MNQNRICPACETEYMPHIEKCADCGAVLVFHEEHRRAKEAKKSLMAKAVEDSVVVRQGDVNWLSDLYKTLIDSGIPCAVTSDGCHKGCCHDKYLLVVSRKDYERAQERIEEYFMEVDPEFRLSKELANQGKCPACGSPVGDSDTECSDCGLTLVIITGGKEEKDDRQLTDSQDVI